MQVYVLLTTTFRYPDNKAHQQKVKLPALSALDATWLARKINELEWDNNEGRITREAVAMVRVFAGADAIDIALCELQSTIDCLVSLQSGLRESSKLLDDRE